MANATLTQSRSLVTNSFIGKYEGIPVYLSSTTFDLAVKITLGLPHKQDITTREKAVLCWEAFKAGNRSIDFVDRFIDICTVPDLSTRGKMLHIYPTDEILGPFNDWDTMRAAILLYVEANV